MADEDKSAEFAEREAAFAAREAELEAKMARFAAQAKYEPLVEEWVREGKISPAQKTPWVALFCALPDGDEATFSAADGSKQSLVEFAKSFVNGLPKQIEYGEVSKEEGKKTKTSSFTANGASIGAQSLELYDEAVAFCAANNLDPGDQDQYIKAIEAVSR